MKHFIAILAISSSLAGVSGVAHADGFAPWATVRTGDAAAVTGAAYNVSPVTHVAAGFAPWRELGPAARPVVEPAADVRIGDTAGAIFRPWS